MRHLEALPAEAREPIQQAFEDGRINTRQLGLIAGHLRRVEPGLRRQVADIAVSSPDPVGVAQAATPLSFSRTMRGESAIEAATKSAERARADHEHRREASARNPWLDTPAHLVATNYHKCYGRFSKAAYFYRVRLDEGDDPGWSLCPSEHDLRLLSEALTLDVQILGRILAEVNAELERRQSAGPKLVAIQGGRG
ncbi:MAG: hypothetical protein AB7S38_18370 [Vulcanimicrobiota bacterium]